MALTATLLVCATTMTYIVAHPQGGATKGIEGLNPPPEGAPYRYDKPVPSSDSSYQYPPQNKTLSEQSKPTSDDGYKYDKPGSSQPEGEVTSPATNAPESTPTETTMTDDSYKYEKPSTPFEESSTSKAPETSSTKPASSSTDESYKYDKPEKPFTEGSTTTTASTPTSSSKAPAPNETDDSYQYNPPAKPFEEGSSSTEAPKAMTTAPASPDTKYLPPDMATKPNTPETKKTDDSYQYNPPEKPFEEGSSSTEAPKMMTSAPTSPDTKYLPPDMATKPNTPETNKTDDSYQYNPPAKPFEEGGSTTKAPKITSSAPTSPDTKYLPPKPSTPDTKQTDDSYQYNPPAKPFEDGNSVTETPEPMASAPSSPDMKYLPPEMATAPKSPSKDSNDDAYQYNPPAKPFDDVSSTTEAPKTMTSATSPDMKYLPPDMSTTPNTAETKSTDDSYQYNPPAKPFEDGSSTMEAPKPTEASMTMTSAPTSPDTKYLPPDMGTSPNTETKTDDSYQYNPPAKPFEDGSSTTEAPKTTPAPTTPDTKYLPPDMGTAPNTETKSDDSYQYNPPAKPFEDGSSTTEAPKTTPAPTSPDTKYLPPDMGTAPNMGTKTDDSYQYNPPEKPFEDGSSTTEAPKTTPAPTSPDKKYLPPDMGTAPNTETKSDDSYQYNLPEKPFEDGSSTTEAPKTTPSPTSPDTKYLPPDMGTAPNMGTKTDDSYQYNPPEKPFEDGSSTTEAPKTTPSPTSPDTKYLPPDMATTNNTPETKKNEESSTTTEMPNGSESVAAPPPGKYLPPSKPSTDGYNYDAPKIPFPTPQKSSLPMQPETKYLPPSNGVVPKYLPPNQSTGMYLPPQNSGQASKNSLFSPSPQYHPPPRQGPVGGFPSQGFRPQPFAPVPSFKYAPPSISLHNPIRPFGGQKRSHQTFIPSKQQFPRFGNDQFNTRLTNNFRNSVIKPFAPIQYMTPPSGLDKGTNPNHFPRATLTQPLSRISSYSKFSNSGSSEGQNYFRRLGDNEYDFGYNVNDGQNRFEHFERRMQDASSGSYSVLLPDGRLQTVQYKADRRGYRPVITYSRPNYFF